MLEKKITIFETFPIYLSYPLTSKNRTTNRIILLSIHPLKFYKHKNIPFLSVLLCLFLSTKCILPIHPLNLIALTADKIIFLMDNYNL